MINKRLIEDNQRFVFFFNLFVNSNVISVRFDFHDKVLSFAKKLNLKKLILIRDIIDEDQRNSSGARNYSCGAPFVIEKKKSD